MRMFAYVRASKISPGGREKMFGKKKTEEQKDNMRYANCYRCGWRVPLHNNPAGCIFEIMDMLDMESCRGRSRCKMYVTDSLLKVHLESLLHSDRSEEGK